MHQDDIDALRMASAAMPQVVVVGAGGKAAEPHSLDCMSCVNGSLLAQLARTAWITQ